MFEGGGTSAPARVLYRLPLGSKCLVGLRGVREGRGSRKGYAPWLTSLTGTAAAARRRIDGTGGSAGSVRSARSSNSDGTRWADNAKAPTSRPGPRCRRCREGLAPSLASGGWGLRLADAGYCRVINKTPPCDVSHTFWRATAPILPPRAEEGDRCPHGELRIFLPRTCKGAAHPPSPPFNK